MVSAAFNSALTNQAYIARFEPYLLIEMARTDGQILSDVNALTGQQTAEAANYPFCTIDPNVGVVSVPDKRLNVLGELSSSKKVIGATLEFKDIASKYKKISFF